MKKLRQILWAPALIKWKEPRAFKCFVAHAYRQASPVRWFVWTLGLPFVGGISLMLIPFGLALFQGRPLVPSAPLTFIGLGVIFGVAFALCSIGIQYTPASISCHKDDLVVNIGGRVQRWRYTKFASYHLTTEVFGGQDLRALLLSTKYGHQLVLGLPAALALEPLIQIFQAYGLHEEL